ncbi:MAG: hypothetical protein JWO89_2893 [Verrucomicrobiaceae bacterium]|nr:hypothetical protein [Verrucomicrobiaceae bacterium]
MPDPALPIRAATETAIAHGVTPDRCDILQNSSTLVLRLTESLVARVVQDVDGPRKGTDWFARENAIAEHLTQHGAPVIPLHPDLPAGPHENLGYPINFWQYMTAIEAVPQPPEIGRTLHQCHDVLRTFSQRLPRLGIITESLAILQERELFSSDTRKVLRDHLVTSIETLNAFPHQPLHGDAHFGNLMNTTEGLLWTDWEDAFFGPVEWDVASIIWNAKILEEDHDTANTIVDAYRHAGGQADTQALHQCLIARAAVVTVWYPILYPNPNAERQAKLQHRLKWLKNVKS